MATAAQNLQSAYDSVTAKLAEVLADPKPDYTLPGGVTLNWSAYYRMLSEQVTAARAALLAAQGPYTVVSVAR